MLEIAKALKDKTILIVEDEECVRNINASVLSLLVDRVIESVDGIDGLIKFNENNNIDLIIVDINMPKLDGFSMCEQIRIVNKDIPIIITSGYSESEYAEKIEKCKIAKYLVKPVNNYDLIDAIKEALL